MLWIIIAVFMACFLFSMQDADESQERKCHFPRFRRKFDAQTFSKTLRGKTEDELNDYERNIIERIEHNRWNAYTRAEGYIYSGSPEKASRNDLGKMHSDLRPFDDLSEATKRLDSFVGTK